MADYHAGERRILQDGFQPLDTGEIQVVGRFVEKQNVRLLDQRLGDGQSLAPAA